MKILAIETSCDETAVSVLDASGNFKSPNFKILSNIVSSQVKIHAKWGGVVPNLAKREHLKNLPIVLNKALKQAKIKKPEKKIEIVAVTVGPGLEPALWTGINFVQNLEKEWGKPIIAVNHMEGHILSAFLGRKEFPISNFQFPMLALLVSGGHTELVLIKDWLKYKIIGQTRDDAAGEAFDKVAKMLGLPYPGGPIVAKLAEEKIISPFKLPRPMINSKDYDFSFSGLKTAALYKLKEVDYKNLSPHAKSITRKQIAYEFQRTVIEVLASKTIRAAKRHKIKTIILGGGVVANKELRKQLGQKIKKELPNTKYLMPNTKYTTDNAAMIAAAAYLHALKKDFAKPKFLKAQGNLALK